MSVSMFVMNSDPVKSGAPLLCFCETSIKDQVLEFITSNWQCQYVSHKDSDFFHKDYSQELTVLDHDEGGPALMSWEKIEVPLTESTFSIYPAHLSSFILSSNRALENQEFKDLDFVLLTGQFRTICLFKTDIQKIKDYIFSNDLLKRESEDAEKMYQTKKEAAEHPNVHFTFPNKENIN